LNDVDLTIKPGVTWAGIAQLVNVALQLIGLLILTRLLTPADFGLMAMVATVTAFAGLFRDFGTGAALIQREELTEQLKNTVFWLNVALGVSLTLTVLALSGPIANLFSAPRLELLLNFISPVFLILSLSIAQRSLLERDQKFRVIAKVEISTGIFALLGAVYVASQGGGVYALVLQVLLSATLSGVFFWASAQWRPGFTVSKDSLASIWSFSSNIFVFNLVNYFQRNADSMLIGRYLGSAELGIYNIAYRLLLFPLQTFTFVIGRASFPVYSKFQNQPRKIGNHYLATLGTIALFTAPLKGLIWVLRERAIVIALGDQWLPAAQILAWLAPVGFFQSMVSTSGTVLSSIGRPDILRNLGIVGNLLLVGAIVVGLQWGTVGVAACYCVANLIWVYPVIRTVLKQVSMSFSSFLIEIRFFVLAALAASILTRFVLDSVLTNIFNSTLIVFAIEAAFFMTIYLAILLLFARSQLQSKLSRITQ
jgi:PST family polysaccharide transporter